MAFVKVQKNKAYYKRLQLKYRRRREGKTDYRARRKMVQQDKNKYNTPKYRLVVRRTNKRIITQIVYSTIAGDKVMTQATSTELEKFGVPGGYTNYAACYATGLLIARRALDIVGLADAITGAEEADGEEYRVEEQENERKPFKVILDIGTTQTVAGARCFGVLKGALDGGLHIPHSVKNFPGYVEPDERGQDYTYEAEAHKDRIMGVHVQEYMEQLSEEDPDRYKAQFAKFVEADIEADAVPEMYENAHKQIRENPKFENDTRTVPVTHTRRGPLVVPSEGASYKRFQKKSLAERKNRVLQKKQSALKRMMAAAGADEEEEEEE